MEGGRERTLVCSRAPAASQGLGSENLSTDRVVPWNALPHGTCGTDEWNRDAGLHLGSFRDRWSGLLRWARSWGGSAQGGRSSTRASYFQHQASMRELVALGGALTVPARAWPEEFVLNPGQGARTNTAVPSKAALRDAARACSESASSYIWRARREHSGSTQFTLPLFL